MKACSGSVHGRGSISGAGAMPVPRFIGTSDRAAPPGGLILHEDADCPAPDTVAFDAGEVRSRSESLARQVDGPRGPHRRQPGAALEGAVDREDAECGLSRQWRYPQRIAETGQRMRMAGWEREGDPDALPYREGL